MSRSRRTSNRDTYAADAEDLHREGDGDEPTTKSSGPRDVNAAVRVAQALRLRAQRLSYAEIAHRVGYASAGACHNAIQRELARTIDQSVTTLRREEAAMYDDLQQAFYPLAVGERGLTDALSGEDMGASGADDLEDPDADENRPSINAARLILDVSAARRKLLGLDATKEEAGATPVERRYIGINVEAV